MSRMTFILLITLLLIGCKSLPVRVAIVSPSGWQVAVEGTKR